MARWPCDELTGGVIEMYKILTGSYNRNTTNELVQNKDSDTVLGNGLKLINQRAHYDLVKW